jgi:hypothetical protein
MNMKKLISLVIIFFMLTLLMPVKQSEARGGGGGWFLPGLVVGGILGLGLAPRYYYPPTYYYPPPAYYYPPPNYYYTPPPPNYPPPADLTPPAPSASPSPGGRMFIYPRQNQSEDKQMKDQDECHKWAVGQIGYDPSKPFSGAPDAQTIQKSDDYVRAISACLDGRGYTVR